MKAFIIVIALFASCKGFDGTVVERQASVREVCPKCVLPWAKGVWQPVTKVDYMTRIN